MEPGEQRKGEGGTLLTFTSDGYVFSVGVSFTEWRPFIRSGAWSIALLL